MNQIELEALYGPPAHNAPYTIGETLIYDDSGIIENGTILYVAASDQTGEEDLHYIVSPARAVFPTPVWPTQIIASMP